MLVSNRSTVSSGRFCQGNDRANKSLQNSSIKHLGNFEQLFLVWFDDEERIFHPLVRGAFAVGGDGYHTSGGLQHGPGSIESLAANCVEYHIDLPDLVLEARGCVVNHFIGSKSLHKFCVAGRSRGN